MPLPSTGAISLSDIQSEFGGNNPISLSEYYKNGTYVGSSQSNIPSSGAISFSNFHGAQASSGGPPTPVSSNLGTFSYGGDGVADWSRGYTQYEIIKGLYAVNTSRTEGRYILSDGTTSDFREEATYGGPSFHVLPNAIIQARAGDTIRLETRATAKNYHEYIEYWIYFTSWSRVKDSGRIYMSGNYNHSYSYTIPSGTSPGNYAIGIALSYNSLGATTYRSWQSYSLHIW